MQLVRLPNALGAINETMLLGDAVIAPKGRQVFVSGQVSVDDDLNVVHDTLDAQMAQCYANLDKLLTQAGAEFRNVLQLMMFVHKDAALPGDQLFDIIKRLNLKHNPEGRPSCTAVYVEGLALDGLLMELQAVAVIPDP